MEQAQGERILVAREEPIEHVDEDLLVGPGSMEQGHRGPELLGIVAAEDGDRVARVESEQRLGAAAEPWAEHRVVEVVGGLAGRREGEEDGVGARPETGDLREDVPDPVAGLATGLELGQGLAVVPVAVLSPDESIEVTVVCRHASEGSDRGQTIDTDR